MTNKQKYIYSLMAIAVIIGASVIGFVTNRPGLGLDLKGGLSVVLTAKEKKGVVVNQKSMEQAIFIMQQRVNKLGVSEPAIEQQGGKNIIVQLPGVKDAKKALGIIGQVALLEFAIVKDKYSSQTVSQLNTEKAKGTKVLGKTLMTGKSIETATATFSSDSQTQVGTQPVVEFVLSGEGSNTFAEITTKNLRKRLAIALDGKIITAPTIQSTISGRGQITGLNSIDEARRISLVLQTGNLPFDIDISQHEVVGPTLGADSLRAAAIAGLVGIILVAFFMVGYYRVFGLITWVTMVVFGSTLAGLIVLVNLVLTQFGSAGASFSLPSIAAVIFMFGSAVDSSIIVYERIKEEIRGGRTIRAAMDVGFSHGFQTFLDADLVAFLTAAILFYFGIGPVKGFALVIMLGIIADLTTSFLFTRSVIGLMAQNNIVKSTSWFGMREKAVRE